MLSADVVVVGAGPAGASAAIHLARAGRDVVLVDKATFPRDKCCGDGLTTGALRELESVGLRPAMVGSWREIDEVHLRSPSGRSVTVPLGRPGRGVAAAVARRVDLDAALVDLADDAGATITTGHAVTHVAASATGVRVDLDDGRQIGARYVVGADGMWSPVRKALGAATPGYLGEWHAFRQYFTGVSERAATELMVWFEPDLLPGYAWSFPLPGGRANVGFGIQRDAGVRTGAMKDRWPELLARPHIADFLGATAVPEAPHKAWPIPARVAGSTVVAAGGRALFVGDAAAATDPMTGEGIGQALSTGRWAAEAMLAAGALAPARAASRYRHRVCTELVPDALLSRALVEILRRPAGTRAAVWAAGSGAWASRQFGRWLFEDYPRALVATPWRWRPGALGGTGAWAARR